MLERPVITIIEVSSSASNRIAITCIVVLYRDTIREGGQDWNVNKQDRTTDPKAAPEYNKVVPKQYKVKTTIWLSIRYIRV